MNIVYLNGVFLPASDAHISVFDRGFLFGDSVYEVIPFYQGEGFQLSHHIQRLRHSLRAVRIHSELDWADIVKELVEQNGGGNLSVYLQVSRGDVGERSHSFDEAMAPTVFACCQPIRDIYALDTGEVEPIKAIVTADMRGNRCDIKSTCLQPNIMVLQQARAQGAGEALQMRDGLLTEGTSSNLYIVRQNVIYTPKLGSEILGGVTRQLVLELADEHGIQLQETDLDYEQLLDADEVWISSSTRAVVPVVEVDGEMIGDGVPGPLWKQMYQLFVEYHQVLMTGRKDG